MSRVNTLLLPFILVAVLGAAAWAEDGPVVASEPQPVSAFDLQEFAGRIVLVDFWASWCAPCRHSVPWLGTMQKKYGPQGLQIVMVNLDRKASAATEMAAGIDPKIRQFLDPAGKLAASYDLQGMPSSYLYDRSGRLISSHVGFLEADAERQEQALVSALKREGS